MSSPARTNQLLHHAELLLAEEGGSDEQVMARRMAFEEAALATLELALDSLLREVTEHTSQTLGGWRAWFEARDVQVAELDRLRELAAAEESWLAVLLTHVESLHADRGASSRRPQKGLIASGQSPALADQLCWCHREFKALLPSLREGSQEW
ncbi:DUF6586 family protein [Salinicola aestuarinus]|uniref:DUF6586 family protein n=1 Tax=Salinicola aestuarinus TaxID=1949082 RepID=UPI000DA10AC0|nr:DUF6586 family protein [Salinicola aestuarinus]